MNQYFSLIKKIDTYTEEKIAAGEQLPFGKTGMRFLALADFCLYGTSFSEFFAYRFYALNRHAKLTFMTRRHMFRFFDRYNDPVIRARVGDKRLTKEYYGDLMRREQFRYQQGYDEFVSYCEGKRQLFIKRAISWGGKARTLQTSPHPKQSMPHGQN